jgi:hypothetical protein
MKCSRTHLSHIGNFFDGTLGDQSIYRHLFRLAKPVIYSICVYMCMYMVHIYGHMSNARGMCSTCDTDSICLGLAYQELAAVSIHIHNIIYNNIYI